MISLPPEFQTPAREAYGIALRQVFKYAAISTLIAFVIRLAVSLFVCLFVCFAGGFGSLLRVELIVKLCAL